MTAKDLILQAEESYRTQMPENAHPVILLCEYTRLSSCVGCLFIWKDSPQEHKYWEEYYNTLIKQGL